MAVLNSQSAPTHKMHDVWSRLHHHAPRINFDWARLYRGSISSGVPFDAEGF